MAAARGPRSFDSAQVRGAERARAVAEHLAAECGRCRVTHLCAEDRVWARWRCLPLSATTEVLHYDGSAVHVTRRAEDVAAGRVDRLLLGVPGSSGGTLWQAGTLFRLSPGDLVLVDDGAPYDYRAGEGSRAVVRVARADLGMTPDQVRAAATRLRGSPLHDLVRDHVRALAALDVSLDPGLAQATWRLCTALLLSCLG